ARDPAPGGAELAIRLPLVLPALDDTIERIGGQGYSRWTAPHTLPRSFLLLAGRWCDRVRTIYGRIYRMHSTLMCCLTTVPEKFAWIKTSALPALMPPGTLIEET